MDSIQLIAFAFACLMIGLSKGGLGGPLTVTLIIPMLSLVMDPREAVPLTVPFLIVADWFALPVFWNKWNGYLVRLMLPSAIVGVVIGGLLLKVIPVVGLKITIGVLTLLVIGYKLLSDRLENVKYKPQSWHGYLAGWVTGITATLANIGAPSFTVYMLLQRLDPISFIGTATLFFAIVNLVKIPIFLQQGLLDFQLILSAIWALPIIPLGVWLGRKSLDYIDQQTFERIMMVLLFAVVILLFVTL